MSSMNDFRSWLDSKDPKIVRSLVLDAYSSDRKFLRAFEKVVDPEFSSVTGKSWTKIFLVETDWDFHKNGNYLLESSHWDSSTKQTMVEVLDVIATSLNVKWKSSSEQIDESRSVNQGSIASLTQKEYQQKRLYLEARKKPSYDAFKSQEVDSHIYHQQSQKITRPPASSYKHQTTSSSASKSTWEAATASLFVLISIGVLISFGVTIRENSQTSTNYEHDEQATTESSQSQATTESSQSDYTSLRESRELREARELYDEAVLMCEHEQVILKLKNIKYNTRNLNNKTAAAELIKKSNEKITFLKQEGKYGEYSEDHKCTYGFQWFDTDTTNAHRAFLAVSGKCNTSSMRFINKNEATGSVLKIREINTSYLRGSTGEILVPYLNEYDVSTVVTPGDFICNNEVQ